MTSIYNKLYGIEGDYTLVAKDGVRVLMHKAILRGVKYFSNVFNDPILSVVFKDEFDLSAYAGTAVEQFKEYVYMGVITRREFREECEKTKEDYLGVMILAQDLGFTFMKTGISVMSKFYGNKKNGEKVFELNDTFKEQREKVLLKHLAWLRNTTSSRDDKFKLINKTRVDAFLLDENMNIQGLDKKNTERLIDTLYEIDAELNVSKCDVKGLITLMDSTACNFEEELIEKLTKENKEELKECADRFGLEDLQKAVAALGN